VAPASSRHQYSGDFWWAPRRKKEKGIVVLPPKTPHLPSSGTRAFIRSVFLFAALACIAPTLSAQSQSPPLRAEITMFKQQYLAGEPVYVHFETTNTSKEPLQYATGEPYAEFCSGYHVDVSASDSAHSPCPAVVDSECMGGLEILSPGATLRQNILVNYQHNLSKPGDYQIHASRVFRYASVGDPGLSTSSKQFKLEKTFRIQVFPANRESLQMIYQVYVTNLRSSDDEIQREAERVIASGAPPWLEDTIVGMLRRYTSREFALLGLKNLNTPRSRQELANIVQNTSEGTPESETAAAYLAQLGDKKYFPMLQEIAKKLPPNESRTYVLAAAQLGGDDALPFLQDLLNSSDTTARATAILALEKTGSRAAVPVLLAVLKNSNPDLGHLVLNSLADLTHRAVQASNDPPSDLYASWANWWAAQGNSATIYGPEQCAAAQPLP
jgi:HEAT repeats